MTRSARNASVTAVEPLGEGVVQLTVSLSSGFTFAPGQYVTLRFGDRLNRAYCIASAPERPEALQLCIRLGSGEGSAAIQRLKIGDSVELDGPAGDFILPEGDNRSVVFIAGDVGIAPVRSIVLHMVATDDRRPITVLYEPRGSNVLYAGDFDPLARNERIRYEAGPVAGLISRHGETIRESILMVAGFEPFLQTIRDAMISLGYPHDKMIVESFGKQS